MQDYTQTGAASRSSSQGVRLNNVSVMSLSLHALCEGAGNWMEREEDFSWRARYVSWELQWIEWSLKKKISRGEQGIFHGSCRELSGAWRRRFLMESKVHFMGAAVNWVELEEEDYSRRARYISWELQGIEWSLKKNISRGEQVIFHGSCRELSGAWRRRLLVESKVHFMGAAVNWVELQEEDFSWRARYISWELQGIEWSVKKFTRGEQGTFHGSCSELSGVWRRRLLAESKVHFMRAAGNWMEREEDFSWRARYISWELQRIEWSLKKKITRGEQGTFHGSCSELSGAWRRRLLAESKVHFMGAAGNWVELEEEDFSLRARYISWELQGIEWSLKNKITRGEQGTFHGSCSELSGASRRRFLVESKVHFMGAAGNWVELEEEDFSWSRQQGTFHGSCRALNGVWRRRFLVESKVHFMRAAGNWVELEEEDFSWRARYISWELQWIEWSVKKKISRGVDSKVYCTGAVSFSKD